MDSKQIASVRRAVSRARNSGRRARYSKFVKDTVRSWIADGESPAEVSSTVDIGLQTVIAWSSDIENKFRQVQVLRAELTSNRRLSATLASGVRLTSPSIDLLIEALERFK